MGDTGDGRHPLCTRDFEKFQLMQEFFPSTVP